MNGKYVETKNLSVQYQDHVALENVEFSCEKGEFVVIVGRSGSGKSTFLNALASFINYTGEIIAPENIGYIFQRHSLFPFMTVAENIGFGLKNLKNPITDIRVLHLLEIIGMSGMGSRYPNQLSGGQVQRVALARTFAPEPELILMDEPYSNLDDHTRSQMQDWLVSLLQSSDKPKTVILVTHNIDEAIYLGDRLLLLENKSFATEIKISFNRPRRGDLKLTSEFLRVKAEITRLMQQYE